MATNLDQSTPLTPLNHPDQTPKPTGMPSRLADALRKTGAPLPGDATPLSENASTEVKKNIPATDDAAPQANDAGAKPQADALAPKAETQHRVGTLVSEDAVLHRYGTNGQPAAPATDDATPRLSDADTELKTVRMPIPLTDEDQALRSLDDTVMRPMPEHTTIWGEEIRRPREEEQPRRFRVPTAALMCVVAVVSFVAGGVVARVSAQMPVLFSDAPVTTESVATYTEQPTQTIEQPLTVPEKENEEDTTTDSSPNPPSYDTGYDTVDDTPYQWDNQQDQQWDYQQEQTTDDNTWQWELDQNGEDSITYDHDNNRVTIDYDGYSLSVPIGEFIGNSDELNTLYTPDRTDSYSDRNRNYDGTGYDTEEERDRYQWSSPNSYGWS